MADISKIKIEDGTYNIKDEVARQGVASLQTPRKLFTNRKIIFLGDSYGTGHNSINSDNTTSWVTLVPQYLGISSSQIYSNCADGSGFKAGLTFKSQLESVASGITDKNSITDIIIIGGYNDKDYSVSDIETKMAEFFTYAKATFPNADMKLACVGWSKNYDVRQAISSKVIPTYTKCGKYGCLYLTNTEFILHDYRLFSPDDFHPSQDGQNELSSYLATAISTGSCDVVRSWVNVGYTMGSDMTSAGIAGDGFIVESQVNGTIFFWAYLGYLTCNPTNFNNRKELKLLQLNDALISGIGLPIMAQYQNLFYVDSSNTQGYMDVSYSLLYDPTTKRPNLLLRRQSAGNTISNVNAMLTDYIYLELPALLC